MEKMPRRRSIKAEDSILEDEQYSSDNLGEFDNQDLVEKMPVSEQDRVSTIWSEF